MLVDYADVDLNSRPTTKNFETDLQRVVDAVAAAMEAGRSQEEFFAEAIDHARVLLRCSKDVPPETAVSAAWFLILLLDGGAGEGPTTERTE